MPITVATLMELIRDAAASRTEAEREVEALQRQVRELMERVEDLRTEEQAFRSALQRRFPEAPEIVQSGPDQSALREAAPGESWVDLPRTVAVERAIQALNADGSTVSPPEIESYLSSRGRSDTRDEIGGATAHLNRKNRIHSLGRGQWAHGPAPHKTPEDTAGTVPSGLLLEESEEGGDEVGAMLPAPPTDHDQVQF